jgi:low temperature requirement protein LtrA
VRTAARQDPDRAPAARKYAWTIGLTQIGWLTLAVLHLPLRAFAVAGAPLLALELAGPILAERRSPTPWNARHIAERHGLLLLITLGESIFGTVSVLNTLVHGERGWTLEAGLFAVAGIALTVGLWWTFFAVPWGSVLERHRSGSTLWGLGHVLLFGSITATGAGLHVAAYFLEGTSQLGPTGTLIAVAVPVALYVLALYAIGATFLRQRDPFYLLLLAGTAAVIAFAVISASLGLPVPWTLVILLLAPAVTVVGYETAGHRHLAQTLSSGIVHRPM